MPIARSCGRRGSGVCCRRRRVDRDCSWDLSERADGERSGDDYGLRDRHRRLHDHRGRCWPRADQAHAGGGGGVRAGGLVAWTALFTWRAGTAEVSGANIFMVPLVIAFVPIGLVVPVLTRSWAGSTVPGRCADNSSRTRPVQTSSNACSAAHGGGGGEVATRGRTFGRLDAADWVGV